MLWIKEIHILIIISNQWKELLYIVYKDNSFTHQLITIHFQTTAK